MRLSAFLIVLLIVSTAVAQTPRDRPGMSRTPGEIQVRAKKAVGQTMPFNAVFTESGGWVLTDPPRTSGSGIPALAMSKIRAYQRDGKRIDIFEIAPNGQWVLIADNYRFYSSRAYFDRIGLRPKIEEYLQKGLRFDALAFATTGDWVLVAENHRYYSTGSGFDRMGLRPVLNELIEAGERIVDIAINPYNGFVILTKDEYRMRFVPESLKRRLNGLRGREITFRSIEFNKRNYEADKGWLLVSDRRFWAHRFEQSICSGLKDFMTVQGSCSRASPVIAPASPGNANAPVRDTKEDTSKK